MLNSSSIALELATLAQTQSLGVYLGQTLDTGTVLLLEGDLGSGKTTLVQAIGAGLGITEAIVSPTFALVQEYPEGRVPLYHFDLYRLSSPEVEELHPELYWEGLEVPLGIVAIEWPMRLVEQPQSFIQIALTHSEQGRKVVISGSDSASSSLIEGLRNFQFAD
ncbi:MAG: tRNA (adenosine(37)-N6)-threonylcarbamoyltransferase complex ATPase subunit type 1 TsaE [Thermosynechococcaceae cyanobacterium MS004]|nr:tRNA (adenosine(37)-N6)-threonylcarbamoyltransferase complex ATPase subunit type 1 TsaE [Thermosynechococcaceae cyanobacterium MS004]